MSSLRVFCLSQMHILSAIPVGSSFTVCRIDCSSPSPTVSHHHLFFFFPHHFFSKELSLCPNSCMCPPVSSWDPQRLNSSQSGPPGREIGHRRMDSGSEGINRHSRVRRFILKRVTSSIECDFQLTKYCRGGKTIFLLPF